MSRNRTLGAPYEQAGVAASFTTEPHIDRYLVSTPGGGPNVTVTLDPNAQDGDQVVILDVAGNAASHPITVAASAGQTIDGTASIGVDGGSVELTFSFGLGNVWTVRGAGNGPVPFPLTGLLPVQDSINAVATTLATVTSYDHSFTPTTTGHVQVLAWMSVVVSAVGDGASFQMRVNGAADPSSVVVNSNSGTGAECSGALSAVYACTAGVPLSVGVQATNTSGGVHTAQSTIGTTRLLWIENQVVIS